MNRFVIIILLTLLCSVLSANETGSNISISYKHGNLEYIKEVHGKKDFIKGKYKIYAHVSPKTYEEKSQDKNLLLKSHKILLHENELTKFKVDLNTTAFNVNKYEFIYRNINQFNKNKEFARYRFVLHDLNGSDINVTFENEVNWVNLTDVNESIDMKNVVYQQKEKLYLIKRMLGLKFDDNWRTSSIPSMDILQRRFFKEINQKTFLKIYTKKNIHLKQLLLGINTNKSKRISEKIVLEKNLLSFQASDKYNIYLVDFGMLFKDIKKKVLYLNELQIFSEEFSKYDIEKLEFGEFDSLSAPYLIHNYEDDIFSHILDLSKYKEFIIKEVEVNYYNDSEDLLYVELNDLHSHLNRYKIEKPFYEKSDFNKLNQYFRTDTFENYSLWAYPLFENNLRTQNLFINNLLENFFYKTLAENTLLLKNKFSETNYRKPVYKSLNGELTFSKKVDIDLEKDDMFVANFTAPDYINVYLEINHHRVLIKPGVYFKINEIYDNVKHIDDLNIIISLDKKNMQSLNDARKYMENKKGELKKEHIDYENIVIDDFKILRKNKINNSEKLDATYPSDFLMNKMSFDTSKVDKYEFITSANSINIFEWGKEDMIVDIPTHLRNITLREISFDLITPDLITNELEIVILIDQKKYTKIVKSTNTKVVLKINDIDKLDNIKIRIPTKYFREQSAISLSNLDLLYKKNKITLSEYLGQEPIAYLKMKKLFIKDSNLSRAIRNGNVYLGEHLIVDVNNLKGFDNKFFNIQSIVLSPVNSLSNDEFFGIVDFDKTKTVKNSSSIVWTLLKFVLLASVIYMAIKYKNTIKNTLFKLREKSFLYMGSLVKMYVEKIYNNRHILTTMLMYILFICLAYVLIIYTHETRFIPLSIFLVEFIVVVMYIKYKHHLVLNVPIIIKNMFIHLISFIGILILFNSFYSDYLQSGTKYYLLLFIPVLYVNIIFVLDYFRNLNKSNAASIVWSVFYSILSLFLYSKITSGVNTNSIYVSFAGIFFVIALSYFSLYLRPWILTQYTSVGKKIYRGKGSIYFAWAILFLVFTALFVSVELDLIAEQFAIIVYYLLVWGIIKEVWGLKKSKSE